MKYRFLIAIIAILATLSIVVYAVDYEYTISASENFLTAQSGDDLDEVAKKLNMTPHDLNTYFTQNGLIYLAVSPDNQTQVKISAFSDHFSSEVKDISYLDDVGLTAFVDAVSEDSDTPATLVENNGRKFLCVKDTLTDSGGVYTVTQYITICNNKTFYFAGYNPGENTSDEISTMFKSFNLQDTQTITEPSFFLVNAGVAIFGVIAILSVISIVTFYIKKHKEQPQNED